MLRKKIFTIIAKIFKENLINFAREFSPEHP